MNDKKLSPLEKARLKMEQAKAELLRLEAKERERVKRERRRVIELWGEVAAAALADGVLSPEQWQMHCRKYLPFDSQKTLALAGIEKYASLSPTHVEAQMARGEPALPIPPHISQEESGAEETDPPHQPPVDK